MSGEVGDDSGRHGHLGDAHTSSWLRRSLLYRRASRMCGTTEQRSKTNQAQVSHLRTHSRR
jgi:hypothetical protein